MSDALKAALRPLVMEILAERGQSTGAVVYSQRQGERPKGCGRPKYLRRWKVAHDAADPGVWAEGRARLMTEEAWARWARTEKTPSKVKGLAKVATPANDLLAEFGARRAG